MARTTTSRHRCTPNRPCHTNRKVAAIFQHYYSGGGGELKLWRGEDEALLSGDPGQGTEKDYCSFLNVSKDGKWMVFMRGAGHNSPGGSNTISLLNLETRDETTIVAASGNNGDYPTDPWILVLTQGDNAGRIIIGYHRAIAATNQRVSYTMYSDDDGDTFTEPDLFTDDQDEGGDDRTLAGPGNAIEYENGVLLKGMYGQAVAGSGARVGWLYKNESDGAGRWEQVNVIWAASAADNGTEPYLFYNGSFVICTQRCEGSEPKRVQLFKLADLDSSWTGPIDPEFPSSGKTPISWDGTMWTMLGRKEGFNGRPFYTYTLDPTAETGWVDGIDLSQRITTYMYGDIVIKTGGFTFYWAQGVFGEPTPGVSGPTIIYKKNMIKSSSVVAPQTTYNDYYRSVLDYAQGFNVVIPGTSDLRALHNQLIEDLTSDGIWENTVAAFIFQHNNTDLGGFSLFNLKNPHRRPTPIVVNAPTYAVDGYDFNGVDQYLNTRFIPFSHGEGIYTQNDAGVYISIKDEFTGGVLDFGGSNANFSNLSVGPRLNSRNESGNATFSINDSTTSSPPVASSVGRYFLQRVDEESNQKRLWKNGAKIFEDTVESVGLCVKEMTVGCLNYANQVNLFSPRKVGCIFFTSSLDGLEAQLDARIAQYEIDVMNL